MRSRARALRTLGGLIGVAAALGALPAHGAERQRWDVVFAIRVATTERTDVTMRLALPEDSDLQHVQRVELTSRGLHAEVVEQPPPHALFQGRLDAGRRVAVAYRVTTVRRLDPRPIEAKPVVDPDPALLPYLAATPVFQARSILVRDFLETYVSPLLDQGKQPDLLRAVYTATREQLNHSRKGKTLVLDVIRRRRAQRLGIERAFTTFLRCAGVPARLVEGINLASSTRRKRVFWTEVWAGDRWAPVSASRGWIGRIPASYVALSRDGVRVLEVESKGKGEIHASYGVETERLRAKRVPREK